MAARVPPEVHSLLDRTDCNLGVHAAPLTAEISLVDI